jgi:hypothetical protein
MLPSTRLTLSSVAFAVLWTAFMLWWSGSLDHVNVVLLTLSGGLAGYGWHYAMRRQLPRGRIPSRRRPPIDPLQDL